MAKLNLSLPKGKNKKFQYLLIALSACSIIYTILARSKADIIIYTFYISLLLFIIFSTVLVISWRKSGFRKIAGSDVVVILVFPIILLFVGLVYYSAAVCVKDTFLWIQSAALSTNGATLFALTMTLVGGFALFYFRLRLRSIYGATETLTGLAVAANKVASETSKDFTNSGFYLAILTASMYLVVRGLDNVHQGLTKEPFDPLALKAYAFIKKIGVRNDIEKKL